MRISGRFKSNKQRWGNGPFPKEHGHTRSCPDDVSHPKAVADEPRSLILASCLRELVSACAVALHAASGSPCASPNCWTFYAIRNISRSKGPSESLVSGGQ